MRKLVRLSSGPLLNSRDPRGTDVVVEGAFRGAIITAPSCAGRVGSRGEFTERAVGDGHNGKPVIHLARYAAELQPYAGQFAEVAEKSENSSSKQYIAVR